MHCCHQSGDFRLILDESMPGALSLSFWNTNVQCLELWPLIALIPPPPSSDMTSRAYSPPLTLLLIGMHGAQCSPKAVHSLSLIRSVPRCKHTEEVPTGLSALVLSAEGWFKWVCETAFPNQTKLNKGLRMHWVAFIKKSNRSLSLSLSLSLWLRLFKHKIRIKSCLTLEGSFLCYAYLWIYRTTKFTSRNQFRFRTKYWLLSSISSNITVGRSYTFFFLKLEQLGMDLLNASNRFCHKDHI